MKRTSLGRFRCVLALISTLALAAAGGSPASAQTEPASEAAAPAPVSDANKAAARAHFEAAQTHFAEGRFAEALAQYEAGYRLAPLPGFLINVAHCYRLMGELRRARAYYRKFLVVEPLSPRRKEVEDVIVELDKAILEVEDGAAPAGKGRADAAGAKGRVNASAFWVWSAIAGQVVGPTVAAMTLAQHGYAAGPLAAQR